MMANFNVIRNDIRELSGLSSQFEENNVHFILCGLDGDTGEVSSSFSGAPADLSFMLNCILGGLYENTIFKNTDDFMKFIENDFKAFMGKYKNRTVVETKGAQYERKH